MEPRNWKWNKMSLLLAVRCLIQGAGIQNNINGDQNPENEN